VKCFISGSVVFILSLSAQDASVRATTSVDINGNRVAEGPQIDQTRSKGGVETTERMQSINGRMVPIERVEERVLREDSNGRLVEKLIHRYDATGNPTTPVKETIEEQKRPDGSSTIQTTRYQGDINGEMRLIQRLITDIRKSGSTETTGTVLQRPLNGSSSLETVEKKDTVRVNEAPGRYTEEVTTYRRDGNGGFGIAVRENRQHSEQGGQATDNTAEYEIGPDGQLQLHSQSVANIITRPDGSKESIVNLFGRNAPGTVDSDGKLKLFEQQLIEQKLKSGNIQMETLSVRRPTVSDTNTLGPLQQISETSCKGKCGTSGH
jgi:hypothetical protein